MNRGKFSKSSVGRTKMLGLSVDEDAYHAFRALAAELGYVGTTAMLRRAVALLFLNYGHAVPPSIQEPDSSRWALLSNRDSLENYVCCLRRRGEPVSPAIRFKLEQLKTKAAQNSIHSESFRAKLTSGPQN